MAEPLLKRTFSRLRGKDRSRRKTEPKLSEATVSSETLQPSPLPSSPSLKPTSSDAPSRPRNYITVAKKQQWAQQGAAAPPPFLNPNHRPLELRDSSGRSQDPSEQSLSQNVTQEKNQHHGDRMYISCAADATSSTCALVGTATQHEALQPTCSYNDKPASSINTKLSGQRTYLQSLDRTSRAWVLSSGKSHESDDVFSPREDNGSNIWYNPIPEEEATGSPLKEEVIWKRRSERIEGIPKKLETDTRVQLEGENDGPLDRGNLTISHQAEDIGAENTDSPPSDSSPASQKKGSVIEKLRSPGTVRKLSLRMKKLPELRRKLSFRSSSRAHRHGNNNTDDSEDVATKNASSGVSNQNVISKYHLDSSTPPARPQRRSSRGRSASKGGYLSDGDSPELLPRQQAPQVSPPQEVPCDVSSFRLYLGADPPRCSQRVTGLLTVHLLGLEDMKTSRDNLELVQLMRPLRSESSKEIFVAIQIDGATRARTALLTLKGSSLTLNHTFHLELERARQLRIVVLTPAAGGHQPATSGGPTRNRVCCLGGVSIPPLFKGSRSQQLCVKLEPRGLLYLKLSLQEKWDTQPMGDTSTPANVFGIELHHLVEKEESSVPVPLLIQKTVAEIERRGLKVVGLYRLCGSAAVKKELRDWFERNSSAVCLTEDLYPDINVITGILKDYLRELPSPLITRTLYQVVREAMAIRPALSAPESPDLQLSRSTVGLLSCLPTPERATLSLLLDHLSLVASFSSFNRMTHQNLAVCFGPVLLTPTQEAWKTGGGGRAGKGAGKGFGPGEEMNGAVDFKRHIEALHYLLQLWPVPAHQVSTDDNPSPPFCPASSHNPLDQHPVINRPQNREEGEVVVSRRGRAGVTRLESPPLINRYAGDWSVCGRNLQFGQEADYDEVAGSESDGGSREEDEEEQKEVWSSGGGGRGSLYVDEFLDFDAPFNCRLSLKDFDTLIHDLDRELAKQINICL